MSHDRPSAPAASAAGTSLAPPAAGAPPAGAPDGVSALLAAVEHARRERDLLAGQLRDVFEQSPVSTIVYDAAGRPLTVNAAFERLWGARLADVPPGYSVLADPQLEAAGVLPLLRRAFGLDGARTDEGAGEPVTVPAVRYDAAHTIGRGEIRWTQAHAYPVRDAAGAVERVVLKHEDVTGRYAAEAALRQLNAELAEQNAALAEQGLELELANQQLQENAAELEVQTEELQETAAALAARTAEAEAARRAVVGTLESMADAYFALDDQFRIVAVNETMERGSGLARAELLGRSFWERFPGAPGSAFERHYRRVVAERVEAHFTHDYSDGRFELVVEVDAYPAAGGGAAVFWRDVTARVRAEAGLRASEAKYRALFTTMDQGFCIVDVLVDGAGRPADYRFVEANPAFEGQTGLVDAVGRTARELVPGLEQHWIDLYGRVALTGEPERFRQGSEAMGRWFDVYAFRIGDPGERRVAILFTDVSAPVAAERERERLLAAEGAARAEAERQRREAEAAEARLRDVFEQAPVAVAVLTGPEHVYTVVSPLYAQNPGTGRPLLGRSVREAFPEIAATGVYEAMDRVYETGEPYFSAERQIFLDRPGGGREEHYFNVGYQPLRDAAGRVYAVASVAYDVTVQVRARREVEAAHAEAERARAAAEAANQAKGQFLANMSHELRTPLNAIGGYAQLLEMGLHGPVTDGQREALGRVQRAQGHLLGLINDVLNYAKLESGRVEYDVRPTLVAEVLADVRPLVEPQFAEKGLAFDVALPEGAGGAAVRVLADREKLGQVLLNLLSNAVKFTAPGGRVAVALEARAGDPGRVGAALLRVRDTGRGVPADKLEAIFEPFVQVGKRYAGEAPGTGLGLAISRDLARGMGGDLTAESTPGAGSTFTLTLPRA